MCCQDDNIFLCNIFGKQSQTVLYPMIVVQDTRNSHYFQRMSIELKPISS